MRNGYSIGLDLGTTNTKVCVCDLNGSILFEKSCPTEIIPVPSGGEIDPDRFIKGIHALLNEAIAYAGAMGIGALRSIGIAGMAEAGCLINCASIPQTNIILWYDSRGEEEAKPYREKYEAQILAVTGIRPGNVPSVYKLMALKKEMPLAGLRWCGVPEFVALSLTYRWYTDRSLAVRCGAYNLNTNNYAHKIIETFGIDPMMFPPCVSALTQDVPLDKSFLREWGLSERVRVVVAGHDDLASAYSLNPQVGEWVVSEGTAECLIAIVDKMPSPLVCGKKGIPISPYYTPDNWAVLSGIGTTGSILSQVSNKTGKDFLEIDRLAAENVPYPENIAKADIVKNRISQLHLKEGFSAAQYAHAVYDLLTTAFFEKAQTLSSVIGAPNRIRFVGGGAALPELCRRKAESLGSVSFSCAERSSSAALGAAMIAIQGEA